MWFVNLLKSGGVFWTPKTPLATGLNTMWYYVELVQQSNVEVTQYIASAVRFSKSTKHLNYFHLTLPLAAAAARCQHFSSGAIGQGVLVTKVLPLGSGAKSRYGVWRTSSPRSWSSLQTLFTDFDCRNDQNLKISHNSPPGSWPVCFTVAGTERHLGADP